MRATITLFVLGSLVAAAPPAAAQPTAGVFERLRGEWRGEGTLMQRPAAFTMTWRAQGALAGLSFSNGFVGPDGARTPVLRAEAVYLTTPGNPRGAWLDTRGVHIEIRWQATDSTLVVEWTAPTESGRTTYTVLSDAEIDVLDEVWTGEAFRTFATAYYRRTGAGGP